MFPFLHLHHRSCPGTFSMSWTCIQLNSLWAPFRLTGDNKIECGSIDGQNCDWGAACKSNYDMAITCSTTQQLPNMTQVSQWCSVLQAQLEESNKTATSTSNGTMEVMGYVVLVIGSLFCIGSVYYVFMYRRKQLVQQQNQLMWAETLKSAVVMSPLFKASITPVEAIMTDDGTEEGTSCMDAFGLWRLETGLLKPLEILSESDEKQVWKGMYDDEIVAIKKLQLHATTGPSWTKFVNEIQLMMRLDSPSIIAMYGVVWTLPDDNNVQLIFEYMDRGNLRDYLTMQRHRSIELWPEKIKYALHLIQGLVYLHEANIIHRDIKSKHVLLNSQGEAKLTDFGWSRAMDPQVLLTQGAGSFRWTAPEILEGNTYTVAADIYSFGMVCYELDAHEIPYASTLRPNSQKALNEFEIIQRVRSQQISLQFGSSCPLTDLATRCIRFNPKDRPTAAQVMQWLVDLQ